MSKELEDDEFVEALVGKTVTEFVFLPGEKLTIKTSYGDSLSIEHDNDEQNEWHLYQIGETEDVIGKPLLRVSVEEFSISAAKDEDDKTMNTITFITKDGGEVSFRWEETGYYTDGIKFIG